MRHGFTEATAMQLGHVMFEVAQLAVEFTRHSKDAFTRGDHKVMAAMMYARLSTVLLTSHLTTPDTLWWQPRV